MFSKSNAHNGVRDVFKEAATKIVRKEHRDVQISNGNEKPFKPVKHVRQPTNATFEHMKEYEHIAKNFRDPENNGEVIIPPRNFLINPPKQGVVGR